MNGVKKKKREKKRLSASASTGGGLLTEPNKQDGAAITTTHAVINTPVSHPGISRYFHQRAALRRRKESAPLNISGLLWFCLLLNLHNSVVKTMQTGRNKSSLSLSHNQICIVWWDHRGGAPRRPAEGIPSHQNPRRFLSGVGRLFIFFQTLGNSRSPVPGPSVSTPPRDLFLRP